MPEKVGYIYFRAAQSSKYYFYNEIEGIFLFATLLHKYNN